MTNVSHIMPLKEYFPLILYCHIFLIITIKWDLHETERYVFLWRMSSRCSSLKMRHFTDYIKIQNFCRTSLMLSMTTQKNIGLTILSRKKKGDKCLLARPEGMKGQNR